MKRLTLMLLLAALTLAPGVAGAQDWVMDWTSHGSSVGVLTGPYAEGWAISGTSPTTLTRSPFGMPTNFSALDKMLGGLQPSDLIIIAGRPSIGKTSFALNIAQNAALHLPRKIVAIHCNSATSRPSGSRWSWMAIS